MVTPLAPSTEVITPWAKTVVAAKAAGQLMSTASWKMGKEMKFVKDKMIDNMKMKREVRPAPKGNG